MKGLTKDFEYLVDLRNQNVDEWAKDLQEIANSNKLNDIAGLRALRVVTDSRIHNIFARC